MDLTEKFVVDSEKASKGVLVNIDGTMFNLLYFGSDVVQLSLVSHTEKNKLTMAQEEAQVAAMNHVLVEHVVLGWKGLKEDGKEAKYSKETLTRLLNEYVGLGLELMGHASSIDNYRREVKEKTEKKS